jgi:hypothetical protein
MTRQPDIDRLLGPAGPELGCDECFEQLDRYVEDSLALGPVFRRCANCVSPDSCARERHCLGMRAHLEGCPACAEEYESLLALVRSGLPPDESGPGRGGATGR